MSPIASLYRDWREIQANYDHLGEAAEEDSWAYRRLVLREDQVLLGIQQTSAWDKSDAAAKMVVLFECGMVDATWQEYDNLRRRADEDIGIAPPFLGTMTVWRRIEDGLVNAENFVVLVSRFWLLGALVM
jgi:hypothetical protein